MTLNELTCEMMFNSNLATVKGTTVFVMQLDIAACNVMYLYTAHITFVSWRFTILIERKSNHHHSNH